MLSVLRNSDIVLREYNLQVLIMRKSGNFIALVNEGRAKAKENRPLHLMGCMLYWGEGSKSNKSFQFTNSDSNMMLLFMRFLREEIEVKTSEISLYVQCHASDPDKIKEIENYWIDVLQLPVVCHRKTRIKVGNPNVTHKNYKNGFCTIYVRKPNLFAHVLGAIQEYSGFDNTKWLDLG